MGNEEMKNKETNVYHVGLFYQNKRFVYNFEVEAEDKLDALTAVERWLTHALAKPYSPFKILGCAWSITDHAVRDIQIQHGRNIVNCTLKINHLHLIRKEN